MSCCKDFDRATDSGHWGRFLNDNDSNMSSLPDIRYCPWCGTSLQGSTDPEASATGDQK